MSLFRTIMKLNLILLTVVLSAGMLHAGPSFGQNVMIQLKNTNLETVFSEIEKQTGYAFFYEGNITTDTFDAEFSDVELATVLTEILTPLKLDYYQRDRQIVIIDEKAPVPQDATRDAPQNRGMTVTGTVTDSDGEPVIGALVLLQGTTVGIPTDGKGQFALTNIPADGTLVISCIGYNTVEISVNNQAVIDVLLIENALHIETVVAVGYGTQKKENLTGAVESVNSQVLINRPATNTSQLLQGNISGVNFTYSNYGAEPGAALSLTIRGQGTPYVVIDGAPGNMNMVNPNDIESISVLKDAAASAIYGARAPYGVVLITTKSGKNNQKVNVNFSGNVSITNVINKPKQVDSYTFARAMNEMYRNEGKSDMHIDNETIDRILAYQADPSLPETVPNGETNKWQEYRYANGNNDWIDIHYGHGVRHQENVSANGGGEKLSFFLSAGHTYEKGPFRYGTDNYRRLNYSSKLDFNMTKWWKLSSNTRLVQTERKFPNGDSEGSYRTMIHQIIRTQPQDYFKSPNGYYSMRSRIPFMENGVERTTNKGLVQRFATEITPLRNWTINADYVLDFMYNDHDNIKPTAYLDNVDGTLYPLSTTQPSSITKYKSHTLYQTINAYSTYEASINDAHNFKIMAGYQFELNQYDRLEVSRNDLITSNVPAIKTATGDPTATDNMTHWATSGVFARLNYDYKGRYLFEANFRYDGSSKFAAGHRTSGFPSFSAGWNIANEEFWKPLTQYVNNFKLRASWGRLGSQERAAAYQDLPRFTVSNQLSWIIDGKRPAYVTGPTLVNPNHSWETSEIINVGIDLAFLSNRLTVTADIYQRLTRGVLGDGAQLPAVLGVSMPQENVAKCRTRGWDLSLSWRDNPTKDFSYSITATLFDHRTVYLEFPNETGILTQEYSGMVEGEIWGYETVGMIKSPAVAHAMTESGRQRDIYGGDWKTGDIIYADLNGDGKVGPGDNTLGNPGDRRIIGNTTPRYQFGLTLAAEWKGLDFKAFFQGVGKRDYWLSGNMFWGFSSWNQTSLFSNHLDYYRDEEADKYIGLSMNTDAYFPRPYYTGSVDSKNKQVQTKYLQNGAYIRLKNLQLGYTLPQAWLDKISIQTLRIYISCENLWTISSLPSGFDPETANMGQLGNGKSMFTQSVYAVGLNLSF